MSISISLPDSLLLATRQSAAQFEAEAKKAIALKFYADEKLSLGQAAELSGMGKYEFMKYLGQNGVSIFRFDGDDLNNDIEAAERFANG